MNKTTYRLSNLISIVAILLVFIITSGLIYSSQRGLDITDESYYLIKIFFPEDDVSAVMSYGKVIFPLTKVLPNLIGIRLFGIALISLLSFVLSLYYCRILEKYFEIKEEKGDAIIRYCSLTLFSFSYYFQYLLITPSYNLMSLIGAITFVIGSFVLILRKDNFKYFFSLTILLNIGSLLMFISRAPGAVMISLVGVAFLFPFLRSTERKKVFFTYFFSGLLSVALFVFYTEGSFENYLKRVTVGLKLFSLLESGHSITDLIKNGLKDFLIYTNIFKIFLRNLSFVVLFVCFSLIFKNRFKIKTNLLLNLALIVNLCIVFVYQWITDATIDLVQIAYDQILIILIVLIFYAFNKKISPNILKRIIGFNMFFFFVAISTKFGTNNTLMASTGGSLVFYGMMLLLNSNYFFYSFILRRMYVLIWCFLLFYSCLYAMMYPYRLKKPIWFQNTKIFIMDKSSIYVDEETASWINDLRSVSFSNLWKKGGGLIDLTGASPGASIILDARAVGAPWLLGGYSGSGAFAKYALSLSFCSSIENAWLLTSDNAKLGISAKDIMSEFEINFPADYKNVGTVKFNGYRSETQSIWKPNDNLHAKNCRR